MLGSIALLLTSSFNLSEPDIYPIKFTYEATRTETFKEVEILIQKNGDKIETQVKVDHWGDKRTVEFFKSLKKRRKQLPHRTEILSELARQQEQAVVERIIVFDQEEFEHLEQELRRFKKSGRKPDVMSGQEGTVWNLELGHGHHWFRYKIWSPHIRTGERKLHEFKSTCEMLLSTAGIDPMDVEVSRAGEKARRNAPVNKKEVAFIKR